MILTLLNSIGHYELFRLYFINMIRYFTKKLTCVRTLLIQFFECVSIEKIGNQLELFLEFFAGNSSGLHLIEFVFEKHAALNFWIVQINK